VLSAESAQANFSLPPPPGLPSGATPTKQQLADWYRLAVLERYGGVYMDATNVNFRSVEHWVDVRSLAVQGFNRPANVRVVGQDEVMENWAIAAPPNSTFVRVWLAHFADALRRGPDEWAADQLRTPGQELLLSGLNSYLAEHIAWVLTRHELSPVAAPTIVLSSTDVGRPFHYLMFVDWVTVWGVLNTMPSSHPHAHTDFFKFRGAERNCVSPLWMYSTFHFFPFAPWGSGSVAEWLRDQLEAEPDLLAASYVPAVRFQDVGLWMLLWWMPLTLFSVSGVILMWAIAYATSERCAGWTDSRCPCCFMCCIGLGWCPQRKARERADTDESDGAPLAGGTGQMQHRRRYPPATLERPHTAN